MVTFCHLSNSGAGRQSCMGRCRSVASRHVENLSNLYCIQLSTMVNRLDWYLFLRFVDNVVVAKSYVTNNDKPNANDPPLSGHIANQLTSLDPAVSGDIALQIEELIRSFGALGQCMYRVFLPTSPILMRYPRFRRQLCCDQSNSTTCSEHIRPDNSSDTRLPTCRHEV